MELAFEWVGAGVVPPPPPPPLQVESGQKGKLDQYSYSMADTKALKGGELGKSSKHGPWLVQTKNGGGGEFYLFIYLFLFQ